MGDMIIDLGGVSIYLTGVLLAFSYIWGSFVFYKKAVESHHEDEAILDMIVLAAFWGFIGSRVSYVLLNLPLFWGHWSRAFLLVAYPGLDGWGFLLGMALGVWWVVRRYKYKLLDLLDLVNLGVLSGLSLFLVSINFIVLHWQTLTVGLMFFLGYILFWDLEKKYRLIDWYRAQKTSAKSGFVFGFSCSFLSLVLFVWDVLLGTTSLANTIWHVAVVVFGLTLVYIRSGRVLTEDINSLKIWNKKNKK